MTGEPAFSSLYARNSPEPGIVAALMGNYICWKCERVADQVQLIAELNQDCNLVSWSRQQPSIGGQRIKEAEEPQPVHEITGEGIDRDHAFSFPRGT